MYKRFVTGSVRTLILLSVIFAASFKANNCEADGSNEIVIGVNFSSSSGKSASDWNEMANSLLSMTMEETGVKAVFKKYENNAAILEAIKKGTIDGANLAVPQMVDLHKSGIQIYPWATYSIGKNRKSNYCFWHAKNAPIHNISDVVGKSIIKDTFMPIDLLEIRELLFRNGIDKPLWQVFKSFTIVPNMNSAFMAVMVGKADIAWEGDDWKILLKILNPSISSNLTYEICLDHDYGRGMFFFNKKKISKETFDKLKEALGKVDKLIAVYAKKDTGVLQLKQYMSMAKVKIVSADENELDGELQIYNKAKTNGWLQEAEYVSNKVRSAPKGTAVSAKPDYEYCRKICSKETNVVKCVEKCLGD